MGRSTIRTQDRRRNTLLPFSLGRARGLVDLNYTKCFSICISYAHVCGISSTAHHLLHIIYCPDFEREFAFYPWGDGSRTAGAPLVRDEQNKRRGKKRGRRGGKRVKEKGGRGIAQMSLRSTMLGSIPYSYITFPLAFARMAFICSFFVLWDHSQFSSGLHIIIIIGP